MPIRLWKCSICGRIDEDKSVIEDCENQPLLNFKYKVGWNIDEYDSDFNAVVIGRFIGNYKGRHVVLYKIEYREVFSPDQKGIYEGDFLESILDSSQEVGYWTGHEPFSKVGKD